MNNGLFGDNSFSLKPSICMQLEETAGTKSKVLESTEGRQMRGFTQTQLPSRDSKAKFGVTAVSKAGAPVEVEPEVLEAVAGVRNDGNALNWVLAGWFILFFFSVV